MECEERVTSSERIYSGHILSLEKQRVVTPGVKVETREIVHHAPAIALLMITNDHKVILEQQWRKNA